MCEVLTYLLDSIFIKLSIKIYRQIVGLRMDTNFAPLIADFLLFCYERDFITSLSYNKEADIILECKSPSRYVDDPLEIDNS